MILWSQGSCLSDEKCFSFTVEVLKRCGSYMQVFTVYTDYLGLTVISHYSDRLTEEGKPFMRLT